MSAMPPRYLEWMTRDFARSRGIFIAILVALAIFLEVAVNGVAVLGVPRVALTFVVLATAGIVSRDIAGGYYRTLFARPVSPVRYYLRQWLVGGAAVLLGTLLIDLGVALRLRVPTAGVGLLVRAALAYLLLGGLILFFSTVTRRDWLVAALLALGHYAAGAVRHAELWYSGAADVVYQVLPPFHHVGLVAPAPTTAQSAHVALYGSGLVLAALAVLRRRPLGAGMHD